MSLAFDHSADRRRPNPARALARQRRDFAQIDRTRREARIPLSKLLVESGVHSETYYIGKSGRAKSHGRTLQRLADALDRLRNGHRAPPPPPATRALIHATEALLGARIDADPRAAAACLSSTTTSKTAPTSKAARLRTLAIYLLTVEIEIRNSDVADAAECTRQNVNKARATIEGLREDGGALDQVLTACAAILRGGA